MLHSPFQLELCSRCRAKTGITMDVRFVYLLVVLRYAVGPATTSPESRCVALRFFLQPLIIYRIDNSYVKFDLG